MYTPHCVYAIKHTDELSGMLNGRRSGTWQEGRRWVTAKEWVDRAREKGQTVPILFAPADQEGDVQYCARLKKVELSGKITTYEFEDFRALDAPIAKAVLLLRNGRRMNGKFIRSYALCRTPEELSDRA